MTQLAFDRSVRDYDVDGRMRVSVAHITREQVAPYLTEEIPGWEELGLEPGRVYNLYRSAAEIEKAAPSAAGIPLLRRHVPVNAQDHKPHDVVGALGTEITFNAPYLDAPLIVWAADSIESIEDGSQKELSCGYYYTPVLQNGVFEGQEYQLLMTNLVFNHCALVEAGRAGPTVVVGDSAISLTIPETEKPMAKTNKPSLAAVLTRGALLANVVPKLAADQKIDSTKLTAGVTFKNLAAKLPGILGAIKPKLAQDSDFAAIQIAFDAVAEEAKKMEAEDEDPEMQPPGASDEEDEEAEKKAKEKAAMDAEEADEKEKAAMKEKKDERAAMDAAMDAKITAATKAVREQVLADARATREAEAFARPYVGEIAIACDSAHQVYKAALDILKVDVTGVPEVAYKHILAAQPKPGERKHVIAQDSAVIASDRASFATRFPNSRAAH